jgi:hypothetical protein
MANPENLRAPWKPGESGNPKGRPKNRVPEMVAKIFGKSRLRKLYKLSGGEVDAWEQMLLIMTPNELQALAKWEDCPTYPKGLIMGILFDMKNGRTTTIDKLRERQYGATTQKIEVSGKDGAAGLMVEIIDRRDQVADSDTTDDQEEEQAPQYDD